MLSGEEIEKAKKEGYEIIGNFKSATTELTKDIFPKKAEAVEILLRYIDQLEQSNQKLIEKLKNDNEKDTEDVKYYEKARRNLDIEHIFYKKSYQTQIHKLNAKREVRREILSLLKGEKE